MVKKELQSYWETTKKYIYKYSQLLLRPGLIILVFMLVNSIFLFSRVVEQKTTWLTSIEKEEGSEIIFSHWQSTPFESGQIFEGQFRASLDNLGAISIRFYNFDRINSDQVIFRFKEKNSQEWIIQRTYTTDQFQPHELFPFGFSPIPNSKDKWYQFELESVEASEKNAVTFSDQSFPIELTYQFPLDTIVLSQIDSLADIASRRVSRFLEKNGQDLIRLNIICILVSAISYLLIKHIELTLSFPLFVFIKKKIFKKNAKAFHLIYKYTERFLLSDFELTKPAYTFFILWFFFLAFFVRFTYYFQPEHVAESMYFSSGGSGDYDIMFRFSSLLARDSNQSIVFWSWANDYVFLTRIIATFFRWFGIINGFFATTFFSIIVSSFVCISPFLTAQVTLKKNWFLAGMVGSLFLITNSLSIFLATGRLVDTFTSFLNFLFLYGVIRAYQTKSKSWLVLAGIFGFVDGLNRGIMFLSDFGAISLLSVILFFSQLSLKDIKKGLAQQINLSIIFHSFLPTLVFLTMYFIWLGTFFFFFHEHWWFSIFRLFHISTSHAIVSTAERFKLPLISKMQTLFELTLYQLVSILHIHWKVFVFGILLTILSSKQHKTRTISIILLFSSTLTLVIMNHFYILQSIDHSVFPVNYLVGIGTDELLHIAVVALFLLVSLVFFSLEITPIVLVFVPYVLLVMISFNQSFGERHFLQLVVIFSSLLGIIFQSIINNFRKIRNIVMIVGVLGLSLFSVHLVVSTLGQFEHAYDVFELNSLYYQAIDRQIDSNAILLIGGQQENIPQIYHQANRSVIANMFMEPLFFPKNEKLFPLKIKKNATLYSEFQFSQSYTLNEKSITPTLQELLADHDSNHIPVYVLDTGEKSVRMALSSSETMYPFFPPERFMLQTVSLDGNPRKIYQLVPKYYE